MSYLRLTFVLNVDDMALQLNFAVQIIFIIAGQRYRHVFLYTLHDSENLLQHFAFYETVKPRNIFFQGAVCMHLISP